MPGVGFSGSQGVPDQTPVNKPSAQATGAGALGFLGRVPMVAWLGLGLVALWWWNRKKG